MASVQHPSPNRWVVNLASRSNPDSEVMVELHMSRTTAGKLARLEAARIVALNPDTPCSTTMAIRALYSLQRLDFRMAIISYPDFPFDKLCRCSHKSSVIAAVTDSVNREI